ncbi:hypothetical protein FNAPI_5469 [Fusarium napiforme]|uniref:PA14 domain-containing protein n=1 Tax=Fusarium napiforme TaxID=42672 RepID=A0A8H5N949_9HYPO|nr:hypothetical protein FNAPI_5469 [Fusarium napiforme]
MHSNKLLSLALSLFVAESVVAGPCKPKTATSATSVVSTTLVASTTTTLPVSSTTDTTVATIGTTTADETTTTVGEMTATTETGTTTADSTTTEAQTTTTTEAETTTAEGTTTTAAEPVCAQTLVLANPTPIITRADTDDGNQGFTAPFPIGVFGASSTSVFVSSNGLLSLDTGSDAYSNGALPHSDIPAVSILPYWDDQSFRRDICNTGAFYDVYETDRGQTLTVEWYVGSVESSGFKEHYSASFYQDYPGLVRFEYYTTTKHGGSATIGVQSGQDYTQYSYDQENAVPDRFYVEIDTSSGVGVIDSDPL